MTFMESSATIARQAVWDDSFKKNVVKAFVGASCILLGTSSIEPFILAGNPKPTISQVSRYVRAAFFTSSMLDYKLRMEAWQAGQASIVSLRQLRLLKALSRIRHGSIMIVVGTWICHGMNVYYTKYHEVQQQMAVGRVELPVDQSVGQDKVVCVRLTPTLPTGLHGLLRRPVYVRISPFNLSSAPIPHLDYSVASQLLSQSIAKFYHEQHLSHLPLLQYAYERIHAALTTQPQYCIPRGRVFVQSYDSQISTPKEFMRSFLTGLYSPLAQEVMGESDLNRAIGLCMDLLAHTYPLMTHAHKDCLHSIQLFHLHVHWQSPSLSEFTRDYNGCAVLPSLRDLFQAYMCGGDESDVKHAHRQSSSAKKAMALSDWQEKIYQLFLHSYETQLVSHSPHEGVSSEYFLFQVDARPFLLYTATKQLLQSYSMWRLQHAKGSLENVFERSVRIVKGDHESHVSSAKDKDPFFIDQTLSAIESIGRRVRSSLSGIVYGLASVFTATSEAKVIEKKIKIAVYVDQESTVVAPVLFTGQRGNVKTMVNLGDYICQGLNHIGMHVSTLWTDKDLRDSIDKEQMPVILTLGHSLPWLYYRIQVLSQRYPNVPIYAIHVHNHQAVGHSENISVSKEGDGVLPAHVQLVSTQALQEEIWSLFQLRLAKELEEQVGKGIGN